MSGRKNIITPYKILDGQSLAAAFESPPVDIAWQDNVAVEIVTSGVTTNSGQFSIQVTISGSTWQDVTLSPSIPALNNANDTIVCNLNQLPFKAFRIAFTGPGGGANGSATAWIMSKAV